MLVAGEQVLGASAGGGSQGEHAGRVPLSLMGILQQLHSCIKGRELIDEDNDKGNSACGGVMAGGATEGGVQGSRRNPDAMEFMVGLLGEWQGCT